MSITALCPRRGTCASLRTRPPAVHPLREPGGRRCKESWTGYAKHSPSARKCFMKDLHREAAAPRAVGCSSGAIRPRAV